MWYHVKRYVLTKYNSFESSYKTWEKKKEIDKAYRTDTRTIGITISRPLLIRTVVGVLSTGLIITGALYTGRIIKNIDFTSLSTGKNNRLSTKNPNRASVPAISDYEAKNGGQVDTSTLAMTLSKEHSAIVSSTDKRAYKSPVAMNNLILANKINDTMYFLRIVNNVWSVFREFNIAYGAKAGRKQKEGDKKTPEGLYFITGRKEKIELNNMYGPLAFVLNYPNKEDRKAGRTGNGIWIHGTNPDSVPNNTRGCLELSNKDISELGSFIKRGIGIPVFIINKKLKKSPAVFPDYTKIEAERRNFLYEYTEKRDFFIAILNKWEAAWESKKIENYENFYNTEDFFSQGMHWDIWKAKKERTFELYTKIDISIDNIFLADFSESTAVLKFVQRYESDRFNTVDGKKLSLVKKDKQWRIRKEIPIPKEELLL